MPREHESFHQGRINHRSSSPSETTIRTRPFRAYTRFNIEIRQIRTLDDSQLSKSDSGIPVQTWKKKDLQSTPVGSNRKLSSQPNNPSLSSLFPRTSRSSSTEKVLVKKNCASFEVRTMSDHGPILIKLFHAGPSGERPFRLEKFWLDHQDFPNLILSEIIEMIHKLRIFKCTNGACAIKLDLEKAFDKLEWKPSSIVHLAEDFEGDPQEKQLHLVIFLGRSLPLATDSVDAQLVGSGFQKSGVGDPNTTNSQSFQGKTLVATSAMEIQSVAIITNQEWLVAFSAAKNNSNEFNFRLHQTTVAASNKPKRAIVFSSSTHCPDAFIDISIGGAVAISKKSKFSELTMADTVICLPIQVQRGEPIVKKDRTMFIPSKSITTLGE
ncbi:hypothetical protein ACH5RR_002994 [Cinchona calisaya]|uniref:Reverse transcriptase domain-containing protein n=1 Tax=Cinchona calisaya TaxID=153742 RepID=A0ABD3ATJ8_9GENT